MGGAGEDRGARSPGSDGATGAGPGISGRDVRPPGGCGGGHAGEGGLTYREGPARRSRP
jgi:hypothetical protein